jgi:hypothetical protein
MADANYEPSETGWAAIAMSPDILDACVTEAKRGRAFGEAIAPRSGDNEGTPYAESFDVVPGVTHAFRRGPRVLATLYNDAPHSPAVEWGNKRMPRPHRVFGRIAAFLASE